jgi:hypothetical protein
MVQYGLPNGTPRGRTSCSKVSTARAATGPRLQAVFIGAGGYTSVWCSDSGGGSTGGRDFSNATDSELAGHLASDAHTGTVPVPWHNRLERSQGDCLEIDESNFVAPA